MGTLCTTATPSARATWWTAGDVCGKKFCTRSYWHDLCHDVLGRPLHHEPTKGGPDERARFEANYRATLEAYAREFDRQAPAAWWPDVMTRFAGAGAGRWVDDRDHWVIDKRRLGRVARRVAAAALLPTLLVACDLFEATDDGWRLAETGVWVAALLIGLPVLALVQWSFVNPSTRRRRGGGGAFELGCGDDGGCSGCSGCGGCSD